MLRKKKKAPEFAEEIISDPVMTTNIKLIFSILATAIVSAGGGSLVTSQSAATGAAAGAANVCDGVVEKFLEKMENSQKACDDRIRMCWASKRNR